ncbi:MAG: alkaline phosphatase family protein [Pseudomonadota bacterium]|nr:alkaline phosphatase family protein [Pseudomonadota bacterium]
MKFCTPLAAAALAALIALPLHAKDEPAPPKLIVAISVDQFSADLFDEYRPHAHGGFARLLTGAVFHNGYQSHAATETCPGHSTILTGFRPEHTGIIANNWFDAKAPRADKTVYCAEDESVPGTTHDGSYVVSDKHLLVPTLGERMKAANTATRVVSVAGKDRAAVMMGGHRVDELWWWDGKAYVSYAGRAVPPVVARANAATAALIAQPQDALEVPLWCAGHDAPVDLGEGKTVGAGHYVRTAGDGKAYRASPAFDAATFALAAGLIQDMKLGHGPATDIIDIGASATDYIGHTYGTEGAEMCIQLDQLDTTLGRFFDVLDATGVDYEVVLTADHGGNDLPERERVGGIPQAQRVDISLAPAIMGKAVAAKLGIAGPTLRGDIPNGDIWLDPGLNAAQRKTVLAAAVIAYEAKPQVAAVFTGTQIAGATEPKGDPATWTLIEKARASYNPLHSGDLLVFLKPRVTAIPDALRGYVATHGSPWNYDRRVPIVFWRKGMAGFDHDGSVETVDIVPTLAHTIGFAMPKVDGQCRDLANNGDPCR